MHSKVLFLMIILINSTVGRLVRWRSEVEIFLGRWRRSLAGQPQVGRAVPDDKLQLVRFHVVD